VKINHCLLPKVCAHNVYIEAKKQSLQTKGNS